ncbi:MAG: agmatinase [Deltaproteobacteria bacterium]|nr:agmatinase [Deltaproteobacteria bacterium]
MSATTDNSGRPFLDPPDDGAAVPRIGILPVPFEATTSYGQGTAAGPAAILEASCQVEFYDEELDCEPYRVGLQTLPAVNFSGVVGADAIARIDTAMSGILANEQWPLALGGEHAMTTGCVRACLRRHPGLGVLQIDAHGDLRAAYEDSPWSHASVMRRIVELGCPTVGVGLRSICPEEREFIRANRLPRWFAYQMAANDDWMDAAIAALPAKIFLTVDVDGIDPSLIRATGTPEPGGIGWWPLLRFLRRVFQQREVVGADVVELAPTANDHTSNFTVAKLAYKLIGYWGISRHLL